MAPADFRSGVQNDNLIEITVTGRSSAKGQAGARATILQGRGRKLAFQSEEPHRPWARSEKRFTR